MSVQRKVLSGGTRIPTLDQPAINGLKHTLSRSEKVVDDLTEWAAQVSTQISQIDQDQQKQALLLESAATEIKQVQRDVSRIEKSMDQFHRELLKIVKYGLAGLFLIVVISLGISAAAIGTSLSANIAGQTVDISPK